jgi:hypothetical protein
MSGTASKTARFLREGKFAMHWMNMVGPLGNAMAMCLLLRKGQQGSRDA